MRTGGFDQMPAKATSSGTSSGAATRTLPSPLAAAFAAHSARARALTSIAHTVARRGPSGQGQRHGAVAAAQVEQVGRCVVGTGRLEQQQLGAGIDVPAGEHAAVGGEMEPQVGQVEDDVVRSGRDGRRSLK